MIPEMGRGHICAILCTLIITMRDTLTLEETARHDEVDEVQEL